MSAPNAGLRHAQLRRDPLEHRVGRMRLIIGLRRQRLFHRSHPGGTLVNGSQREQPGEDAARESTGARAENDAQDRSRRQRDDQREADAAAARPGAEADELGLGAGPEEGLEAGADAVHGRAVGLEVGGCSSARRGSSIGPGSMIATFTFTIAFARSAVGMICRSTPFHFCPGNASTVTSAGCPSCS